MVAVDIEGGDDPQDPIQGRLFDYEEWTSAIYTKIVQKVGTRAYWEDWARDVAAIAARHETRITHILDSSPAAASAFDEFLGELHATLNDSINRDDAVSMVSQHLITRPIFEALFGDDAFAAANPVSQAMSGNVNRKRYSGFLFRPRLRPLRNNSTSSALETTCTGFFTPGL